MFDRPNLPIWHPAMRVTDQEMKNVIDGMERAEKGGYFSNLFVPIKQPVSCDIQKGDLLEDIRPDMNLTKGFFKRTYSYAITNPGFEELVISKLEEAGCSRARGYYTTIKEAYDQEYDESLRPVAAEYHSKLEQKWKQEDKKKEGEEERKWKIMQDLQQKSDRELLSLLQSMK